MMSLAFLGQPALLPECLSWWITRALTVRSILDSLLRGGRVPFVIGVLAPCFNPPFDDAAFKSPAPTPPEPTTEQGPKLVVTPPARPPPPLLCVSIR